MTPLPDLAALVREAALEELPALAARCREAELLAETRLRNATPMQGEDHSDDRLLTLPELADLLGVSEDYAYTLARQRKIPVVHLPGLDKGGRNRSGKYIRVRLATLRAWAKEHEDKGLDGSLIRVIKSVRDRPRSAKNPKGPRAVASGLREARGRDLRDGKPLGDGCDADPGAYGEAHQAARETV